MGTKLDIAHLNETLEVVGKYFDLRHVAVDEPKKYVRLKLIKNNGRTQKSAVLSIHSDNDIHIYIDCLPSNLPNLSANKRELSPSAYFPRGTEIIYGSTKFEEFKKDFIVLAQSI